MFSTHRDFQVCEGDSYSCKWFSPLSKVEVVETDYHHDIWDYIVARGQRSNNGTKSVHVQELQMFAIACVYSIMNVTALQNGVGGGGGGGGGD